MTDHQNDKNWQEELEGMIAQIPEDQKQRAHDFMVGYLAALKEDCKQEAS